MTIDNGLRKRDVSGVKREWWEAFIGGSTIVRFYSVCICVCVSHQWPQDTSIEENSSFHVISGRDACIKLAVQMNDPSIFFLFSFSYLIFKLNYDELNSNFKIQHFFLYLWPTLSTFRHLRMRKCSISFFEKMVVNT